MPDARAQWELKRTIVQQKLDEVLPRAMRAHRIDMWIVEDRAIPTARSGWLGQPPAAGCHEDSGVLAGEIRNISGAHFLSFLMRTQVWREGCFTRSRVSTVMPTSFYPLPLQLFNGYCQIELVTDRMVQ